MTTNSKTRRPLRGDGEYRKHRDKRQSRDYWKRERTAVKREIQKTREES
ncbi:hypothetical protein C1752_16043 [Acaryochloris thomasi RCC1774]|uniref:Uncharacterized protein n=1 Tax=Acaryochloris thomasi RCC1774 TaxID=1764569 RepID=A0A2W1J6N0_9CYAN|nr:hypothetical protein [Acaryochloris thomasi]PZD70220.1 hypothetical protein C1752_16043 [Acaryochloris thomasi RCC1774]